MSLNSLKTPSLVLDIERVRQNAARMSDVTKRNNVRLRPHIKTHKCIEVARIQTAGCDGAITVSTLAEAKAFAKHGFTRLQGINLDDLHNAGELSSAFDFVYLTGGNPIVFRDNSLRVGLSSRLRAFLNRGGVIIGASGGAMLLTRNVALFKLEGGTFSDAVASHDALTATGLLDYEMLPHANRFGVAVIEQLGEYARRVACDVITLNDGAAMIHTTPQAVRNMRHRGQAPEGFRRGRVVLFPRAEVDKWLAAQLDSDRLAARARAFADVA